MVASIRQHISNATAPLITGRRWGWLLVIVLLGLVISLETKSVHAQDTVINFDNLPDGTLVRSQYHDLGVDFISDPGGSRDAEGVPNVWADSLAASAPNVASLRRLDCSGEFCGGTAWGRFTSARQRVQINVGNFGGNPSDTRSVVLSVLDADQNLITSSEAVVTGGAGFGTILSASSSTANIWYVKISAGMASSFIAFDNLQFDRPITPPEPDFGLTRVGPSVLVPAGTSSTTTVRILRLGGSSGSIHLTVSGLPTGMSASLSSNIVDGSTDADVTLTLTALNTASPSAGEIIVTGIPGTATAGLEPRSTTIPFTIPGFRLDWKSPHPSAIPVFVGSNNTTEILVTRVGFSFGTINLTVSGLPEGLIANLSPAGVIGGGNATVLLTLSALDTALPVESIPITITGTPGDTGAGSQPQSTTVLVRIPAWDSIAVPHQPHIKWGGRAVAVDVSPANTGIAMVASESGGLFRTTNKGRNWTHINTLPPFRLLDVKYDPSHDAHIIVAAKVNSSVPNGGGIWRSTDHGATWQQPPTATRPGTGGCDAYSIAFAGGSSSNVYVGTACGLAVSTDGGETWAYPLLEPVFAVTARPNEIVDVCVARGHRRSRESGLNFGPVSPGLNGCNGITTAPASESVIFVTRSIFLPDLVCLGRKGSWALAVFEGDVVSDGSITWTKISIDHCGGRPPFVVTHSSANGIAGHFDLYYGTGFDTFRQTCSGSATVPGGPKSGCSIAASTQVQVDHADQSDMAFSITVDNCPQYLVSDGGIHTTSDCGATWTITGSGNGGYNALQLYEVIGQVHPGTATDLYIGTQDNDLWASGDGGMTWPGEIGAEGFFLQVPYRSPTRDGQTVTGVSCYVCRNFKSASLFSGVSNWNNPPGRNGNPFLIEPGVYIQWQDLGLTPPQYSLFLSTDTGATWTTKLTTRQSLAGRPQIAGPAAAPTIYQGVEMPGGMGYGLLKITGIRGGSSSVIPTDLGFGSIGTYCMGEGTFVCPLVFGVDPTDPQHLIAADMNGTGQMVVSSNGGNSWMVDATLTSLVTRFGTRLFNGPLVVGAAIQPHVIAFDPTDGNRILVGTEAAGIIASVDGGKHWRLLPNSSQVPAITGFFFDEVNKTVFVSTYGRGLWKMNRDEIDVAAKFGIPTKLIALSDQASNSLLERPAEQQMNTELPYLQLVGSLPIMGQTMATTSDTVLAYGSGFCGVTGCSPVTLSVGERIAAQGVPVNADGTFTTTFTILEAPNPGFYPVTALQTDANGGELTDATLLIVPVHEEEEEEMESQKGYLPLITGP